MGTENEGAAETNEAPEGQAQVADAVDQNNQSKDNAEGNTSADLLAETGDNKSTNEKTGDEKPDDKEGDKEADKDETKVEYEEFTFAEGVEIDQELLGGATALFSEFGLNQEQAQKMINLYAGQQEAAAKAQEAMIAETQKSWEKALKDDPVYGGKNFESTSLKAAKAFKQFTNDETNQFFKDTGLNKHPVFVKLFKRIGDQVLEDEMSEGETVNEPVAITDRWYKGSK